MYNDPQLLHLDAMLTAFSVGYENDEFVGDNLMPAITVGKQSNKYYVQEKTGMTVLDDIRAPKARANEVPPVTLSRDTYFAEEHALVDLVAPEETENADDPIDPLQDATTRLSDTILLNRENLIMSMATTTTNYATGHVVTLAGGQQWSDYVNSDPVGDLKKGRDQIHFDTFKIPNTVLMGYDIGTKLEDHPKIVDRFKYVDPDRSSFDNLGRLLGGGVNFIKAGAVKNTAAVGQAQTFAYMWGKNVVMAYVNPRPTRRSVSFGYEYVWPFGGPGGPVMPTERWFDNDHIAQKVRVRRRYDLKLFAVDSVASGKSVAGYLIAAAIA